MSRRPPPPATALHYAERALPASQSSADRLPAAALVAFQNLHARLRTVFGATACDVLFRRAFSRAARQHPILEMVEAPPSLEDFVNALPARIGSSSAHGVAAGVRAVMVEQISLLTRLIGEDLVHTLLGSDEVEESDLRGKGEGVER